MPRRTHAFSATREPTEMEIQHAAYLLRVENGRSEGRDPAHWPTAKDMLCHQSGRDSKACHPEADRPRVATGPNDIKDRRGTS